MFLPIEVKYTILYCNLVFQVPVALFLLIVFLNLFIIRGIVDLCDNT